MGLLFLVESPDKDPYYYYLYCLIVPIFILGFISSLVTFAAFVLAKSSMQSRVYNLLATIVFLNMIWSLFNVVTYLISLYYNSEFFSRLNESSNPVWLEIVLWFNVVLAMERYFHVCGVGPRLSRIWFVVGLTSCFSLIGLIIWNQSTVRRSQF
ncbi:hypothetical protein BCR33DRAFT_504588 [Rhizoclosmatium globosum]|uniref:G-protein coupled receptors family 2 profile 2 domain-containing protein n=1 Tax=Rhizoclosmatium globosum TaxID=329046 RepID=A0A1Y2BM07_9FUNG|nr:hypothetical protein BCR33DRAFT_504588 [Rhizoclosmatium globosum]|eukprot:ORY35185.1 hypothetical protein BCR33DRAFT_504588 [Rhizoclosmatium globosum]